MKDGLGREPEPWRGHVNSGRVGPSDMMARAPGTAPGRRDR
jgi:hypothetical protein